MTSCMSSQRSNHLGYASLDGVYYIILFWVCQVETAIFLSEIFILAAEVSPLPNENVLCKKLNIFSKKGLTRAKKVV